MNLTMWRRGYLTGVILLCMLNGGCTYTLTKWQFQSAERKASRGNYAEALTLLERIVIKNPSQPLGLEAARKGIQIAIYDLKDFTVAERLLRALILASKNPEERVQAQRELADIYYEKLFDFEKAVVEYERLLRQLPAAERPAYRLKLARAHSNLNNVDQAVLEADEIIGNKKIKGPLRFETILFKANLLQLSKRPHEAVPLYLELINEWPELSKKEAVSLNLAVCYEDLGDLKNAIDILERSKKDLPSPQFIEVRIARLRERMENLPGAQGFKR